MRFLKYFVFLASKLLPYLALSQSTGENHRGVLRFPITLSLDGVGSLV